LFLPLHVGVELILAIGMFNKASGFYGILSIFTGHPIGAVEWVLNIVSLCLLPFYVVTYAKFAKKDALQMLVFAYAYVADTFINLGLTIFFCVHWFTSVSRKVQSPMGAKVGSGISGNEDSWVEAGEELATTATLVVETVTTVAAAAVNTLVGAAKTAHVMDGMNDIAMNIERRSEAHAQDINKSATLAQETGISITITVALLLVRFYFMFVVLGYGRHLVRQQNLRKHNGEPSGSLRSWVQFLALSFCESFWTGVSNSLSAYSTVSRDPDEIARLNDDYADK
jgi:hypothetical protein